MKTLFVGQKIIHLKSVDSTNNYTTKLSRQSDIPEGLVVSAEFQTNGKGQRNSQWWAGVGENLTISVLLKPHFLAAESQFLLSMAVALSVKETVDDFVPFKAQIKWPNDILVLNKKIAGVLIENSLNGSRIEHSVIGVGLNVNATVSDALPHATSLFEIANKQTDIQAVLEVFCAKLEANYLKLRQAPDAIYTRYTKEVIGFGQLRNFADANGTFTATLEKIELDGRLKLKDENGLVRFYWFKELTQLDIYR